MNNNLTKKELLELLKDVDDDTVIKFRNQKNKDMAILAFRDKMKMTGSNGNKFNLVVFELQEDNTWTF